MKTVLRIALAALAIVGFARCRSAGSDICRCRPPSPNSGFQANGPHRHAASLLSCSRSRAVRPPSSSYGETRTARASTSRVRRNSRTILPRWSFAPNSVFKGDTLAGRVRCGCAAFNATVVAARVVLCRTTVGFLHHDEQTTVCCSPSHAAQPANSDALMKELFAQVTRWPQRLLPRDHTEAGMRWCRRHLMATAISGA